MPKCEANGCNNDGTVEWVVDGHKGLLCEPCKHLAQIEGLEFPGWEKEKGRSRASDKGEPKTETEPVTEPAASADGKVPEV